MIKNLSEREKKIIILSSAFLIAFSLGFLQLYFVKKKISRLDFSYNPISNIGEEVNFEKNEIDEEVKTFEEQLKERGEEIKEELKKLEELENEEQ